MAIREFHWDPIDDCVLSETNGSGNTLVTYSREPGAFGPLLGEDRAGDIRHYHYDALGSTLLLTDDTGAVTDTFQYDAWGGDLERTGVTPTLYRWSGRWGYAFDTRTSGYYIRARNYRPALGRWTSIDPIVSGSLFTFVLNSPLTYSDPSGLEEERCRKDYRQSRSLLVLDARSPNAISAEVFNEISVRVTGDSCCAGQGTPALISIQHTISAGSGSSTSARRLNESEKLLSESVRRPGFLVSPVDSNSANVNCVGENSWRITYVHKDVIGKPLESVSLTRAIKCSLDCIPARRTGDKKATDAIGDCCRPDRCILSKSMLSKLNANALQITLPIGWDPTRSGGKFLDFRLVEFINERVGNKLVAGKRIHSSRDVFEISIRTENDPEFCASPANCEIAISYDDDVVTQFVPHNLF